jgi:sugar/nucleoside kinase (ribokinase family)
MPDRAGRVLVVGDIVTDILAVHSGDIAVGSDTDVRVTVTGGGSAANTAVWLAAVGAEVDLVGVVGLDAAGTERLTELDSAGVGSAWIRRSAARPTGTVIVLARPDERTMLSDRGANALLAPADVDAALAGCDPAHVHLSGYALLDPASRAAGRRVLARARELGRTVSVDAASAAPLRRVGGAAFRHWVRGADLLIANLDEARALLDGADDPTVPATVGGGLGPAARATVDGEAAALARALATVAVRAVVKLGRDGAVWAGPDGEWAGAAADPAAAVDPTGAGDAFAAGLLGAWLRGADPRTCLRAGTAAGARAVTRIGARP